MRIVFALGGNALLERGQPPDASAQEGNILRAVAAVAPMARDHEVVITHGNGPQVGLLARETSHDADLTRPYPSTPWAPRPRGSSATGSSSTSATPSRAVTWSPS